MSKVVEEVTSANADYVANFGVKGDLPMPPGRQFVVVKCFWPRVYG